MARIADLRRAGWVGDDRIVWSAAASMAKFNGATPFLPQRACELSEVGRWREGRAAANSPEATQLPSRLDR